MSQELVSLKNGEERSGSRSADSHTIAAALTSTHLTGSQAVGDQIGEGLPGTDQAGVKIESLEGNGLVKAEPPPAQPSGPTPAQQQVYTSQGNTSAQPLQTDQPQTQAQNFSLTPPSFPAQSSAQPSFANANLVRGQNLYGQPSQQQPGLIGTDGHNSLGNPQANLGQNQPVVQRGPQPAQIVQPSVPGTQNAGLPNGVRGGKQVSISDIQRVQNYIEKCLQLYLSQKEVVQQLDQQCQIEPCFTQLVWQKLEEQNQEFFRAYYTRLKLKDQIVLFNHLLDEQVKMFNRMPRPGPVISGAAPLIQPVSSMPNHSFPQQRLGVPIQTASSQPPPSTSALLQPDTSYPLGSQPAAQQAQPSSSQAEPSPPNDFIGLGLEAETSDLPEDLARQGGHELRYSESDLNLASMGGLGKGLMGGHDSDLAGIPRNFSLGDFGLDHDTGGLPRNISLSDFPVLYPDSGGEQA